MDQLREEIGQDTADRLNKKPKEENEEKEAGRALSSIPVITLLHFREMGKAMKLPYIYRDYYLHAFFSHKTEQISDFVIADDTIFVIDGFMLRLFKRHGDQISTCCDDVGRHIIYYMVIEKIEYACYNKHNKALIIVNKHLEGYRQILSLEVASMQAGQTLNRTLLFPGESSFDGWRFDIPSCRAMIHNSKDKVFKFCELKEYRELFTIPDLGGTSVGSYLNSLSPGNMEMVMYDSKMSISGDHRSLEGISLRIYSKLNGTLRKEFLLPQHSPYFTEFVTLCGSNTLIVQQISLNMEIVEISAGNPKRTSTNIRAACEPYYLDKRSHFICYTESQTIHVCNLQGEILVTLEDHALVDYRPLLPVVSFRNSYISDSQNVLISLGFRSNGWKRFGVYVSSIVTGKCLLKITADVPVCSEIREAALESPVRAFAYDERTHEFFTANDNGACVWSNRFHKDVADVNIWRPRRTTVPE